jgi:hypothetical protein
MCGLAGAILHKPTDQDLEPLRRCVLEASIRGRYATGVAWVRKRKINIEKAAVPAKVSWVSDAVRDLQCVS